MKRRLAQFIEDVGTVIGVLLGCAFMVVTGFMMLNLRLDWLFFWM